MKKLVVTNSSMAGSNGHKPVARPVRPGAFVLCLLALLFCILLSVAPLSHLGGSNQIFTLPTNGFFIAAGSWLPMNFGFSGNLRAAQMSTHILLFISLVALEFLIYGLSIWWIQRQPARSDQRHVLKVIWIGALLGGLVFVFTPAFLSHDAFVYAGYGRVLAVHHANPYFTTLSVFPQDPFFKLDDWRDALAAYGPIWLVVCALGTFLAGDSPLNYVLLYRTIDLLAHLGNILLIIAILRMLGRSPRTIATGALLYAWNPLVLQESSLGAHNDVVMVTCMLLGIFFWVRSEREQDLSLTTLRAYSLPLAAFTFAVLIKFTAAPLLVFFLLLLLRKALYSSTANSSLRQPHTLQWRRAFRTLIPAGLLCAGLIIFCYTPFWIGYSIPEIINSFVAPPSANSSYGSIFSAIFKWVSIYGLPAQNWLAFPLQVLSTRQSWQVITIVLVGSVMLVGIVWLWRVPTTRVMVLATLAVLGTLLIITSWFFPWYVLWLVGLAAICLPAMHTQAARALVAATLVFSASAHFIYYFRGYAPLGDWIGLTFLTTIGPPLLALLLCLFLPLTNPGRKADDTDTLRHLVSTKP